MMLLLFLHPTLAGRFQPDVGNKQAAPEGRRLKLVGQAFQPDSDATVRLESLTYVCRC
jgi:hypothetical protein